MGLDISLNFYLARGEFSSAAAMKIIGVLTSLAVLVGLPFLFLFYRLSGHPGLSIGQLFLFSAFQIVGSLLGSLSASLFTAYGDNHFPSRIGCIINVIMGTTVFVLHYYFSGDMIIKDIFFIYFLLMFLQGLFLYFYAGHLYRGKGRDSIGLPTLLRFSFIAFLTNFIFFLGARIGLYLLPYFATLPERGNYIQAFKVVEYLSTLASFLYYPFIMIVASARKEEMAGKLLFLVRLSNTLILLFCLLILSAGWWLFPFVFGASFTGMYGILIGFIPGLFAACSSTFFTAYFYGTGHLKINLLSACIQLLSAGLLLFLLTGSLAIRGAAWAFSGASVLSMIYDCVELKKYSHYDLADLLLIRRQDIRLISAFLARVKPPRPPLSGSSG